jgi:hypothetical protein
MYSPEPGWMRRSPEGPTRCTAAGRHRWSRNWEGASALVHRLLSRNLDCDGQGTTGRRTEGDRCRQLTHLPGGVLCNCCEHNQPGQRYAKGDVDHRVKPRTTDHNWSVMVANLS